MKKIVLILSLVIFLIPSITKAKDTSSSSIVMDLNSGRILYENNKDEKKLIASTTKIMTAILTIENKELSDKIEVGEEILKMYGTNIYIEVGEKISIKDLLYGLLLRSGNDAAIVLAKNVGGSEEEFIRMMNQKAQELGMTNTKFTNPHGLDDYTENYSTAYDMALLSKYAYQNKIYRKIASTKKYSTKTENKSYLWYNRNKLLSKYDYCTGGKNGYTPKAGRTLVTTAKKDNFELTIVTLNDYNEYDTHKELYEKIYKNYKNYTIIDINKSISIPEKEEKYYVKSSFIYPLTKEEKKQIKTNVKIYKNENINSEKTGKIVVKLKEDMIGEVFLYKENNKKEDVTIFQVLKTYFFDILKKLMLGLQNSLKPGPLVPIPLDMNRSASSIL